MVRPVRGLCQVGGQTGIRSAARASAPAEGRLEGCAQGSRAGSASPAASPARPSAVQAVSQAGDLIGQLRFSGPCAVDHLGRRARHERRVRQALASRSQPALGLGELALQPVAFEVGRVGMRACRRGRRPRARRRPTMIVRSPAVVAASSASGVSSRRSGRARASRSMAGRSASKVVAELERHEDQRLEPVRGGQPGRRAGVPDLRDQVDERADLGFGLRRPAPPPRASARR